MSSDKGILDTQPDSSGYIPDYSLQFTRWKHLGNGHIYEVIDFVWNGETDRWMIYHERTDDLDGVRYVRTPENFFGTRSNGEQRHEVVK